MPTDIDHSSNVRHADAQQTTMDVIRQSLRKLLDSQDLTAILRELFAEPDRNDAYYQALDALSQIQAVPPELLPPELQTPPLPLIETLRLVLTQMSKATIPLPHEPKAVELIGWLDLAMDDAEAVIVTGMNDGCVPAFQTSDMFLPDSMCQQLSIEDNSRRYARDAYAMSCLLTTRQNDPQRTQFVGSRRSVEGDPLLPSRLFFAADDKTVSKRVRDFFAEHRKPLPPVKFVRQEKPDVTFTLPPIPENAGQTIKEMRVTEFAEYKKCPYRYYLKYQYKLCNLNDADVELGTAQFGSLLHNVLELFGKTKSVNRSTSASSIREFLVSALRESVRMQYGDPPRSVVAIQAERAVRRLEAFAEWQANWAKEYEILATELPFTGEPFSLDVDGKTMFLRGRIDRIDRHKTSKKLIIWDYKTGDSADPKNHVKNGEWVDFQLPLYYHLIGQHGELSPLLSHGFQLGYIVLPSTTADTGDKLALWDRASVLSAIEGARDIVRAIWNNHFEKINPPPKYSEEFAAICNDF